jgi:TonB family protein
MDNLFLYLLKVSAGTTLLYLCYLLLFRKDTFYLRNRIFLILTLLLPTIFPILKIPIQATNIIAPVPTIGMGNLLFSGSSFETTAISTVQTSTFDYTEIIICIYLITAGLLLLRIVNSLISTYRIIKKGTVEKRQFPKIIISDNHLPPFSFFPFAVIPSEDYKSGNYTDILDHEFAHLKQGHTFDLLLSEFFIAFQWFNPFIWLIKRSIILNHEYLADQISISKNKSIKEYQYRLLNFQSELKHISLAHNFNRLIKNRIIMINKKPTRKFATMKNILILPVAAFVVYAFATPEYHYTASASDLMSIYQSHPILQKEVKGVVLNEDGKPFKGVQISITGTMGNARLVTTNKDGRFSIENVQDNVLILFSYEGYKQISLKPDFNKEMTVKMIKDPDYKEAVEPPVNDTISAPKKLVVLDGKMTDQSPREIFSKMSLEIGTIKELEGKEATDKYGEAGKNGVTEFYSIGKAQELKLIPFRRKEPEDFPTFQGKNYLTFNDWVINQTKYPSEATEKGLQGRIMATCTVEADGSVSKATIMGKFNALLGDAVIKAIKASPKWEPAKNQKAYGPFENTVSIKFVLPDKVLPDDVYIMSENMPKYPGGDLELLKYISENTNYPDSAKAHNIQGQVIVRFIVDKDGNVVEPEILKGVDPLLDAEALKVVNKLKGFSPGTQGGKPVSVYYMIPISFTLN